MNTLRAQTFTTDIHDLPSDLRRVLKVQFREFIHFIEDAQDNICYPAKSFVRNSKEEAA